MSSEKLKKYLAYYQKTLRDDPENIEARLRLASLFKEMGQRAHAIEEYVAASKLLAAQGLPLEAIAACKAVLELDPAHTEVQFFLAKLFALAPDAAGTSARVARPVLVAKPPVQEEEHSKTIPIDSDLGVSPIPLQRPKQRTPMPDVVPEATRVASAEDIQDELKKSTHGNEATGLYASLSRQERDAIEIELYDEQTSAVEEDSLSDGVGIELSTEFLDDLRRTTEMEVHKSRASNYEFDATLRETQAIDPDDILLSMGLEEVTAPTTQAIFNTSKYLAVPKLKPPPVVDAVDETTASFELDVFDLNDVSLPESEALRLASLDLLDSDVLDDEDNDVPTGRHEPTTVSILRNQLPSIPLFSDLSPMAFVELLKMTTVDDVAAGEVILKPGHNERSVFIVVRGQTMVTKHIGDEDVCLAINSEGDFFGEFGLLTGRDQSATVTATQPTTLLVLSEAAIQAVAEYDPEIWNRLWDYYHIRMLNNLMSSHGIFGKLDQEDRETLIDSFILKEFEPNTLILDINEPCHFVYLVLFGSVVLEPENEPEQGRVLREGEFFGFLPSLSDEPGKTRVKALRETSLLCLSAADFRTLTRKNVKIAGELRHILKSRTASKHKQNLFLCGITHYADSGAY